MRLFIALVLWWLLFIVCWPIAILLFIMYPIIWLLLLPFRLLGFAVEGLFKFIREIFLLPFRVVRTITPR